jgi:hypothetical protein
MIVTLVNVVFKGAIALEAFIFLLMKSADPNNFLPMQVPAITFEMS